MPLELLPHEKVTRGPADVNDSTMEITFDCQYGSLEMQLAPFLCIRPE